MEYFRFPLHVTILFTTISTSSILWTAASLPACDIQAIYNFGDSNSDTGGISAVFPPSVPPNGETFFHRPVGRASDGRLMMDFFSKKNKFVKLLLHFRQYYIVR